jgi:hypothetical protein
MAAAANDSAELSSESPPVTGDGPAAVDGHAQIAAETAPNAGPVTMATTSEPAGEAPQAEAAPTASAAAGETTIVPGVVPAQSVASVGDAPATAMEASSTESTPPTTAVVFPFYRNRSYLARAASIALAAAIGALVGSLSPLAMAPAAEPARPVVQPDLFATAESVSRLTAEVAALKAAFAARPRAFESAPDAASRASVDKLAADVATLKATLADRGARIAAPPAATTASVDALAREVASLKDSFDGARTAGETRLTDLVAQINRTEKMESDLAARLASLEKREATDSGAAPETTGSILPPSTQVADGWVLWRVYNGRAVVQSRHGIFDVMPGVNLPELGFVRAITERDGRWVVITDSGLIVASPGHRLG